MICGLTVGEVGLRAPAQKEGTDPKEADPSKATHPWVAFVCLSRDQQKELGRRFGLQGPWLKLRDPGESL